MRKIKYITDINAVEGLSVEEKERLKKVVEKFAFRANEYYLSLIDWDNPNDPIRNIIIPQMAELEEWGELDASHEGDYTKVPGLQHKYQSTALMLVNEVCGGFCRFCFRKRLFIRGNKEVARDLTQPIEYIRNHPEISNVLLSGGDPLLLSTSRLKSILSELRKIKHVKIIRIGSKMPAYNPYRILDDPELLEVLSTYSEPERRIYIMTQFNHPRELTKEAISALDKLQKAGVILANQTPMLRGINDDPEVLAELFNKLSFIGVPPYYVFQGRPTKGNKPYAVPIERGYDIFEQARANGSGLAKRARFAMSHHLGKIEIMGKTNSMIFFKFQRSALPENDGKVMVFKSNPEAYWFDDYTELIDSYVPFGEQENEFEEVIKYAANS